MKYYFTIIVLLLFSVNNSVKSQIVITDKFLYKLLDSFHENKAVNIDTINVLNTKKMIDFFRLDSSEKYKKEIKYTFRINDENKFQLRNDINRLLIPNKIDSSKKVINYKIEDSILNFRFGTILKKEKNMYLMYLVSCNYNNFDDEFLIYFKLNPWKRLKITKIKKIN